MTDDWKSCDYERITPVGSSDVCPICHARCDAEDIAVCGACSECVDKAYDNGFSGW
jgi:hypothetical protein